MSTEIINETEVVDVVSGDITAYLLNDISTIKSNKAVYPGDRFVQADQAFIVRTIEDAELKDWRNRCTRTIKSKGKMISDFDTARFQDLIIINCTVKPDFKSAEFIKQAGQIEEALAKKEKRDPRRVVTPEDVVSIVLKSGEKDLLVNEITAHSGFEKTLDEEKEDIKNA